MHNALHAVDGASTVSEGAAGVVSLAGADERHAALSFVLTSLPAHADVYACVRAAAQPSGARRARGGHAPHPTRADGA